MTGEQHFDTGLCQYSKYFHYLYVLSLFVQEVCNLELSNITWFDGVVTQFYLKFFNFQKVVCDASPFITLRHYFVPGIKIVRRWNRNVAHEERKSGGTQSTLIKFSRTFQQGLNVRPWSNNSIFHSIFYLTKH